MGYKLAGCNVIGNCEIDPKINEMYVRNNRPKFNFEMDIRDLLNLKEYPEELYNLDILDGSPPCTTFSRIGMREKTWGVEKKFREGQKLQTLDDLFFEFIALAKKLRPKYIIAENVAGLLVGNARGYVRDILIAHDNAGYSTQIFRLNAATMGVPQARERVFFISHRKDISCQRLRLNFNEKPILFGEIRSEKGVPIKRGTQAHRMLLKAKPGDLRISDVLIREEKRYACFSSAIIQDNRVSPTITSSGDFFRYCDKRRISDNDIITASTFPEDYDFCGRGVQYVCGMSVPPLMIKKITKEIIKQWIDKK